MRSLDFRIKALPHHMIFPEVLLIINALKLDFGVLDIENFSLKYLLQLDLIPCRTTSTGTITTIITRNSVFPERISFFEFLPWPYQAFIKSLTVTHNDFLVWKTPSLIGIYLI